MCERAGFFEEKKFCPQNRGNGPKMGQKWGYLILLENLVIIFF